MVARINTVAFQGIEVRPVDVQVQIANGLPCFTIVGLPDKAVAESKERVKSALHSLGIALPPKRLIINLAPADLSKEGSHFDLPIALGVLAVLGVLPKTELEDYYVLGELSLDASIRHVAGVLPTAIYANARHAKLICPKICGGEAAWAGDLDILAPANLLQLINHMKGTQVLSRPEARLGGQDIANMGAHTTNIPDLAEVKGQETAKRALEIAAAGGHNMLMIGPPGSGKSMLASCLPGILPPLSPKEALDVSMVHSLAGTLPEGGLLHHRPFRDPHHSASLPALIGGGHKVKPGEISLAHNGILFLDELPEFARSTLESLRQPIETGNALIARANSHVNYPARFQLIAAMNPCRCGHLGDEELECTKAPRCAGDYQAKISGPMLDRIDLQVDVPRLEIADLQASKQSESSAHVAARVAKARERQLARYAQYSDGHPGLTTNAQASGKILEDIAMLDDEAKSLLNKATQSMRLSARGFYRILRVARTIADLSDIQKNQDSKTLTKSHLAEALSYRRPHYL